MLADKFLDWIIICRDTKPYRIQKPLCDYSVWDQYLHGINQAADFSSMFNFKWYRRWESQINVCQHTFLKQTQSPNYWLSIQKVLQSYLSTLSGSMVNLLSPRGLRKVWSSAEQMTILDNEKWIAMILFQGNKTRTRVYLSMSEPVSPCSLLDFGPYQTRKVLLEVLIFRMWMLGLNDHQRSDTTCEACYWDS